MSFKFQPRRIEQRQEEKEDRINKLNEKFLDRYGVSSFDEFIDELENVLKNTDFEFLRAVYNDGRNKTDCYLSTQIKKYDNNQYQGSFSLYFNYDDTIQLVMDGNSECFLNEYTFDSFIGNLSFCYRLLKDSLYEGFKFEPRRIENREEQRKEREEQIFLQQYEKYGVSSFNELEERFKFELEKNTNFEFIRSTYSMPIIDVHILSGYLIRIYSKELKFYCNLYVNLRFNNEIQISDSGHQLWRENFTWDKLEKFLILAVDFIWQVKLKPKELTESKSSYLKKKSEVKKLNESPFLTHFKNFLESNWKEDAEISLVHSLENYKNLILSHPKQAKQYLADFIEKNSGIINEYCSETFIDELNNLVNLYQINEEFKFEPRKLEDRKKEIIKKFPGMKEASEMFNEFTIIDYIPDPEFEDVYLFLIQFLNGKDLGLCIYNVKRKEFIEEPADLDDYNFTLKSLLKKYPFKVPNSLKEEFKFQPRRIEDRAFEKSERQRKIIDQFESINGKGIDKDLFQNLLAGQEYPDWKCKDNSTYDDAKVEYYEFIEAFLTHSGFKVTDLSKAQISDLESYIDEEWGLNQDEIERFHNSFEPDNNEVDELNEEFKFEPRKLDDRQVKKQELDIKKIKKFESINGPGIDEKEFRRYYNDYQNDYQKETTLEDLKCNYYDSITIWLEDHVDEPVTNLSNKQILMCKNWIENEYDNNYNKLDESFKFEPRKLDSRKETQEGRQRKIIEQFETIDGPGIDAYEFRLWYDDFNLTGAPITTLEDLKVNYYQSVIQWLDYSENKYGPYTNLSRSQISRCINFIENLYYKEKSNLDDDDEDNEQEDQLNELQDHTPYFNKDVKKLITEMEDFKTKLVKDVNELYPGCEVFQLGEYKPIQNILDDKIILINSNGSKSGIKISDIQRNGVLIKEGVEKLKNKDPEFILARLDEFFYTCSSERALSQWTKFKEGLFSKTDNAKDWLEYLENSNSDGKSEIDTAIQIANLNGMDSILEDFFQLKEAMESRNENYLYRADNDHKFQVKLFANVYGLNSGNTIYFTDEDTAKDYEYKNKNKCEYIGKTTLKEGISKEEEFKEAEETLIEKLKNFDWFYMAKENDSFSDGAVEEKNLSDLVKKVDFLSGKKKIGTKLYNKYCQYPGKKEIKESAHYNKMKEDNESELGRDVISFLDKNYPEERFTIQDQQNEVLLQYEYWNELPEDIYKEISKKFKINLELNNRENGAEYYYEISGKQPVLIDNLNEEKKKIDRFAQMKQEIEETKEELENPKPESMKQELTEENTTADMTSYLSGPGKEGMKRVQNYDPYANAGNIVKGTHTEFMIKEHNLNDKNSENIQILLEDNFFKKKKLQSTKKDFSKFIVENCDVDAENFNYDEYLNSRTDSFKKLIIKEYLKTKKI